MQIWTHQTPNLSNLWFDRVRLELSFDYVDSDDDVIPAVDHFLEVQDDDLYKKGICGWNTVCLAADAVPQLNALLLGQDYIWKKINNWPNEHSMSVCLNHLL